MSTLAQIKLAAAREALAAIEATFDAKHRAIVSTPKTARDRQDGQRGRPLLRVAAVTALIAEREAARKAVWSAEAEVAAAPVPAPVDPEPEPLSEPAEEIPSDDYDNPPALDEPEFDDDPESEDEQEG